MELANTSIEISRKLKEVWFNKESNYYWFDNGKSQIVDIDWWMDSKYKVWNVYDVAELINYLCFNTKVCLHIGKEIEPEKNNWVIDFTWNDWTPIYTTTSMRLPDSLWLMLIYLLSNNLIDGNNK